MEHRPSAQFTRCLVADDQEEVRHALGRALSLCGYEVEMASDGLEAIAKLHMGVDLVILDADMPGIDGFEITRRIRAEPSSENLPVVMVTGLDRREDRLRAAEVGVNDFLSKPFDVTELQLRCQWLVKLKRASDELAEHRVQLERKVEERTAVLRQALEETASAHRATHDAHLDTIRRLILASEYKDQQMGSHIERIGEFSALVAQQLAWAPDEVDTIRYASMMHDVGKIGVPDRILLKPGRLTPREQKVMRQHTKIGAHILRGSRSKLLQMGSVVALSHHEKWNGAGYPLGLAGADIPLFARVCAVADVFDALTSVRSYRDALPNAKVIEMMSDERGSHFDPKVLDAFFALPRDTIEMVQRTHMDDTAATKLDGPRST